MHTLTVSCDCIVQSNAGATDQVSAGVINHSRLAGVDNYTVRHHFRQDSDNRCQLGLKKQGFKKETETGGLFDCFGLVLLRFHTG